MVTLKSEKVLLLPRPGPMASFLLREPNAGEPQKPLDVGQRMRDPSTLLSALTFPQSLVIGAPGRAFIGLEKI